MADEDNPLVERIFTVLWPLQEWDMDENLCREAARAVAASVLEQLRDPSEAMLGAAGRIPHARDCEIWQAMLEAAFLQPPDSSNPAE